MGPACTVNLIIKIYFTLHILVQIKFMMLYTSEYTVYGEKSFGENVVLTFRFFLANHEPGIAILNF